MQGLTLADDTAATLCPQVTLCEQVQGYLSRFQESNKSAAAAPAKADIAPLQGMAIYSKKQVRHSGQL